jgi:exodeoxyribonuclease V gamma subunit
MSLYVYRSQRMDELAAMLGAWLSDAWPDDPFEPVPLVVGSRGMERWLRHELATRFGGVAELEFLFPRAAFEAVARWLLAPEERGAPTPTPSSAELLWRLRPAGADPWSGATLALHVLSSIRARLTEPSFERVRRYLGGTEDPVRARELAFAAQVAGTVERLLHDRPGDALAWLSGARAPDPEHAWLAELLGDLHRAIAEPSPAERLRALEVLPASGLTRVLPVFGLSTLRPGDKRRLAALARHVDLHVFALAPSSVWWADHHGPRDLRRALDPAASEDELGDVRAEVERQNSLLAANGGPSRELQRWLEELDYAEPCEPAPLPPPTSLLRELHAWIDRAGDCPARSAWSRHAGDRSIEVHACHGALRQCEALRDELLRRFAADPTLEPRDVLVMALDLATYAPLLAAVFARRQAEPAVPAIPVYIADLGLRSTNAVADALLQTLALATERGTATRLLGVLASRPVRARFGIAEADVGELGAMVADAGLRWAWDAADRRAHDQPELDQNTVRFALERLALGVLMPDPGGQAFVPSRVEGFGPAVPVELGSREQVARFGRLARVCATLEGVRARVERPASAGAWRERLGALLDELTLVEGDEAWLRGQVDQTLAELLPDGASDGLLFDLTAIVALLTDAFELPQHGDRPITGAVTVCALEPMRSVPFRVIAVLGLDDGQFPRAGRPPAWDPFASPRVGEYDRRTVDRHLFLEAVLCAQEALLLFGTGFEPKRGERVPLSVVASELVEILAGGLGTKPSELVVEHPLQPWSAQAFADDARRPFDALWARALNASRGPRAAAGLAATALGAEWPREEPPRRLMASELARALCRPQAELLRRRLGLQLDPEDSRLLDREPLDQGTRESWAVRDAMLRELARGSEGDLDVFEQRSRGEGTLPLGGAGRRSLERCGRDASDAYASARALGGVGIELGSLARVVDGLELVARPTDVRQLGERRAFVWTTASKNPNEQLQLTAWVTLLIARASDEPVDRAVVVGCGAALVLTAPEPEPAHAILEELVRTWRRVRGGVSLLLPRVSKKLVVARRKDALSSAEDLVLQANREWEGSKDSRGALHDPYVKALFGELDIDDLAAHATELVAVAEGVWGPLVDAEAAWRPPADAVDAGDAAAAALGASSLTGREEEA